jgi:hypothetical protein
MEDTMEVAGYHEIWANDREAENATYACRD